MAFSWQSALPSRFGGAVVVFFMSFQQELVEDLVCAALSLKSTNIE
jgi:hypothetical protein